MNRQASHPALAWFADCAPILRAVRLHRRQPPGRLGKLLMAAGILCGLAAVAVAIAMVARTPFGWSGALALVGGGVLAAIACGHLVSAVHVGSMQNSPANAVLVPRLNRLVRRTVLLLWCVAMAGFALVGSQLPHGVLLPLAAHGFLLMLLALRGRAALVWMLLFPLPWLIGSDTLHAVLEIPAVLALIWTGALCLGWRCLHGAFPAGGERHFAASARARRNDVATRSMSGWAAHERTRKERRPVYARLLAHDIEHARPLALLMHVFGPGCQRFDFVLQWLIYGGLSVLAKLALLTWWPDKHDSISGMALIATLGGLVGLSSMAAIRFTISIPLSNGEQRLYRLTPAAPRPHELNRMLAGVVLRICLFEWAGCLLLLLALVAMWGGSAQHLLGAFTAMCAALALNGWPLRDYARDPGTRYWLMVPLLIVAGGACAFAFLTFAQAWLWAVLLGAALLFIRRRYRAMVQAPPAFPARRLQVQ